jgi:amidase
MAGRETIGGCPGPMAVDRDALEIFMKVALSSRPWRIDPALTAKPWKPYTFESPPKIAIQWSDGVVKPHPPMIRALREVAEACRKAGMEVVNWDCQHLDHSKSWDLVSALYWPDGAKEVLGLIEESGEPVLPLTKWIAQEQSSVKELTQHELWKVSVCCHPMREILTCLSCVPKGTRTAHFMRRSGAIPANTVGRSM